MLFRSDLLVAFVLVVTVLAVRHGAAQQVLRGLGWVIGALVAQGALGYVQYWRGIPATLVWFHVIGASLVALAVFELVLTVGRARRPADPCPPLP